jgi:hypothetical protein
MTTARVHPAWQHQHSRHADRQVAVLAAAAGWFLLLFVGLALLLL